MHGVLRRSGNDIQKYPGIDDSTLSWKSLKVLNFSSSPTVVYIRCCKSQCSTDVTFFALEPNGQWKVLILPQQKLYREICWKSSQSNVNSLQVGSLLPLTSLLFGGQKIQRVTYIDSTLESILSSSSLHHEGALSNLNERNMLSITSSGQNPITECEFPGTISCGSDAISVEDMYIHDSEKERSTDKYSRKKPRKKGKRNRNLKCSDGLNELQSAVGCSITKAVIPNIQHRSISSSANICNSLMNDGMTVSSISLGSSSDERFSQRGCKSPHPIGRIEVSSNGDFLNGAKGDGPGQIEELSERKKCSNQHTGNLYGTEKRDKYFRRVPNESNVYASSTANQNSHARKENYQCIWKRVQRSDADVSNCDSEKLNLAFSQFDDRLKKNALKKKFPNPVETIILSQSAHENQEKLKVPKNTRRNKCPGPQQENESQCRKGSPVNGACLNACLKTNMQPDGVFGSPNQIATAKRSINTADSQSRTSSFRARYKKRNVQYVPLKPIPSPKACSRNLDAKENVPIDVSSVDGQMVEHQFLLPSTEKFNGLADQQGELLAGDGEGDKMDKEVSPSGFKHGHDTISQAVSESWMHQELKDSELPNCLSVGTLVEPERWTSKNATQEQLASKCLVPVFSSVNVRMINAGQNVENIKASPGDSQFGKLRNHNTCTLEQGCNNGAMVKFFIPEAKSKTFHSLENDWRTIARAVDDAHTAQLASKAIEIAKGYPAAEFEELLHSASPIICPSASNQTCQACFPSRATNAPLCRHEIPNVALKDLWQWYEKHGNYGLEVKAEDHKNARRCGMDHLEFRAYFVPYLSAIQLFKDHRTLGSMEVDCKMNKISESSPNVGLRSIFSVLLPRPLVEDSSSLLQKGGLSDSGSSSECSNGDLHHMPDESKLSDDVELLFEYFESEQPQRRRPLFETIQELVSGDGPPSNCRSYGDPSILQTVSLQDLHPHSWFSVAWYPIYRIPDGNLRAAFLTYHSLGHFIHREQSLKACGLDACMVSPIVGLQSYNAQGECWFQPRHSANDRTEEFLDMDLHTVLRERLRTLEKTASIMSRAERKIGGSDTLVNIHPDYEFFLSRRR